MTFRRGTAAIQRVFRGRIFQGWSSIHTNALQGSRARGGRVELKGRFGTIRGSSGEYLLVKFDDDETAAIVHPVEPNYVENGEAAEMPLSPPSDDGAAPTRGGA